MATFHVGEATTPVTVTTSEVTLIDWVRSDEFGSMRAIYLNAGGGIGSDIQSITLDESNDASTVDNTQTIDNGPIPANEGDHATFTPGYKYVRLRADTSVTTTTAVAWLTGTSWQGGLCTLADVRTRVGVESSETGDDDMIRDIIRGISGQFDSYCNRTLLMSGADVTELYDGGGKRIKVARYPIVSVTSIKQSIDYDFANETAMTEDDDFHSNDEEGTLYKIGGKFIRGDEVIQVVYKGGYVGPNGTAAAGETELPDDIREAAILQAVFTLQRRNDVGLTSVSSDGFNISKFSAMDLLPVVKKTLNKYKRRVF